jgi:hypothetical protein
MRMTKSKNLLIKQGAVYGVKNRLTMTDVGVQLNAEMNLKAIRRKRRIDMSNTSNFSPSARVAIKEFEAWQMKVFKKNAKKGWRFFNPDHFDKPTPRSAREAWGAPYKPDDFVKNEERNSKIMIGVITGILILLSII